MGKASKHSVRFGVGDETRRAASWNVFANPGKRDVYVACRALRGALKLSLHESGEWRYAFDCHRFPTLFKPETQPATRLIRSYDAPPPVAPRFTLACRIHTSPASVNMTHDVNEAKVTWIPPPPEGTLAEVAVFLCDRVLEPGDWPARGAMSTYFVGQFSLAGGGCVSVVYRYAPFYEATIDLRQGTPYFFKGMSEGDVRLGETRAVAISRHDDGSIVLREGVLQPGAPVNNVVPAPIKDIAE